MIRWEGTYKICWAGNYSFSLRCVEADRDGECEQYESVNFPFYAGDLVIFSGNASVVGQTNLARCDSLDLMAFSPAPPLGNNTHLAALNASWACEPATSELCKSLQPDLQAESTLHLFVSPTTLVNALDRARWVSSSLGYQDLVNDFVLTVAMIDMDNVTRFGSLAVSVSNLQPLVQGLPATNSITLADTLHLSVYIDPPGGITCSETVDITTAAANVSWTLASSSNLSAQLSLHLTYGTVHSLVLQPIEAQALGLGEHNISATVNFDDESFTTQQVFFMVQVLPLPSPVVDLAIPSSGLDSCPIVLSALTSGDDRYSSAALSYTWSCAECSPPLASSSGPVQIIPANSLQAGLRFLQVSTSAANGATTDTGVNITVGDNTSGTAPWPFMAVPMPGLVRADEGLACEAVVAPEGSSCTAPLSTVWLLRTVNASGASSGIPDQLLDEQRLAFNIGSESALLISATIPQAMLQHGGHYRCILRAGSDVMHTSSTMSVVSPPTGGRLIAAPDSGIALETRFTFTSLDWITDQLPIMHAFLMLPDSSSPALAVDVSASHFLRGWSTEDVLACVLGRSGLLYIVARVQDSMGAKAMSWAQVDVQPATPPINYAVRQLAQWPPDSRSLTAAAAALVSVAMVNGSSRRLQSGNSGSSDAGGGQAASASSSSDSGGMTPVTHLLLGLWEASQLSSISSVRQEDLALRAWVLEQTLSLTQDSLTSSTAGPSVPQSLTSSQILERTAAQAGHLGTMAARDSISVNTSMQLLQAASIVSNAVARQQSGPGSSQVLGSGAEVLAGFR
jgi:hypothetical protein